MFARAKEGDDFFTATREAVMQFVYPEDLNRFLSVFTKDNVISEIENHGFFTISYRLMFNGRPTYVQLKGAKVQEKEGERLIFGLNNIDSQVRQEEDYVKNLAKARIEANIDALTGVKNRHAYLMAEERLNEQIENINDLQFAIVILDVNDLKKINDNEGHNAGDQYIKDACKIICETFSHSPVFRIGGDEFAIIAQGSDYNNIDELMNQVHEHNMQARNSGGIVIACGMAKHENEDSVAPVFERADQNMYDNKSDLKS
jgi:diguanylate cyclase (GGDEF)-like protein